jgi:hypothetical protein
MGVYGGFTRLYPDYYRGQMGWVATVLDRLDAWSHPFRALWTEGQRWISLYAATNGTVLQRGTYAIISAFSLIAIIVFCVRRHPSTSKLRPIVVAYVVAAVFVFTFFNNLSTANSFVYRSFIADVCVLALLPSFSRRGLFSGWAIGAAGAAALFAFHLSKDFVFLRKSAEASREYSQLERAARANLKSGDTVVGTLELAFTYGFSPNYMVDDKYGFYSGRRPDVIAIWRENSESPGRIEDVAIGGMCVGNAAGTAHYLRFYGDKIGSRVTRDADRICAYFRDLGASGKSFYRDHHYELIRVGSVAD